MLTDVVAKGTGTEAQIPGYAVGRQDRHGREAAHQRHGLLEDQLRGLVRRHRAGRSIRSCWCWSSSTSRIRSGAASWPRRRSREIASSLCSISRSRPEGAGAATRARRDRRGEVGGGHLVESAPMDVAALVGRHRTRDRRRSLASRSRGSPIIRGDVGPGTLFFCIPGLTADGHEFAAAAVAAGRRRARLRTAARSAGDAGRRVVRAPRHGARSRRACSATRRRASRSSPSRARTARRRRLICWPPASRRPACASAARHRRQPHRRRRDRR